MSDDEMIIFYSWQSDDNKTRNHLEKSIKRAIKQLTTDPDLVLSPRLDKDTQGAVGAVEIANTIMAKIDASHVFVADVSLVDKTSHGRSLVNQNVMYELGYAIGKKTESFVVMVANIDNGNVNDLPFDIRGKRVMPFSITDDPKGDKLVAMIKSALQAHIGAVSNGKQIDLLEQKRGKLLEYIESGKPTRTVADAYFKALYEKILTLALPPATKDTYDGYVEKVFEAYEQSKPLLIELYETVATAAEFKNEDAVLAAYKNLGIITEHYDNNPGDPNPAYKASKDYYGLITYEAISLILGCVTRDEMWATFKKITKTKHRRTKYFGGTRVLDELYYWPEMTFEYYKQSTGNLRSLPPSRIADKRYEDRQDVLQCYIDGSIALYIQTKVYFYPWLAGFLCDFSWPQWVPDFFEKLKQKNTVHAFMDILEIRDEEEFKQKLIKILNNDLGIIAGYHFYNLAHILLEVGISSVKDIGSIA